MTAPAGTPSRHEIDQLVLEACAEVLEVKDVRLDDNFFFLGGDSLAAFELLSRVEEKLGVQLEDTVLFTFLSLSQIAKAISRALDHRSTAGSDYGEGSGTMLETRRTTLWRGRSDDAVLE